jgi:uncharacterized membrane protein YdcZ (DUF606 family)
MRSNKTKIASAAAAAISLLLIALWQLNLFLLQSSADGQLDAQAGTNHLWWAVGSGVLASIIVFSVFSVLVHLDGDDEKHIVSKIKTWNIRR